MTKSGYLLFGLLLFTFYSCKERGTGSNINTSGYGKLASKEKADVSGSGEILDRYVVMVSFDGFRWDYSDLYTTPNFDDLATDGVKAHKMIPSFPTKTFPNHYTLATGLYPDHHGIINNSFYAKELDGVYRIGDRDMVKNPKAYEGEPIWITAEEQGIKAASFFWVGSEAPIQGIYPTYWEEYDESVPYPDRVDQVINWLNLPPKKRPGLVLLYFDEPDHVGHQYGPEHDVTGRTVQYLDSILGCLRSGIESLEHAERVNLIVLSDHGMGPTSKDKYVNLNQYIPKHWIESLAGNNPVYLVDPVEGYDDSITLVLNEVEGVSAWQKEDIPAHLHYGNHVRYPGIVVVADSLWSIGTRPAPTRYKGGTHGYDNTYTGMHTIFYAEGPDFKEGYNHPSFPNVDVYAIIAHILELDPAENDSDLDRVSNMFSE